MNVRGTSRVHAPSRNITAAGILTFFFLPCAFLAPHPVHAGTWNVPGDAATIQAGIDSAASGDTVAVGPGIYYERLKVRGKNIALIGVEGRENTILSGSGMVGDTLSILTLYDVDTTTVITGLTFQDNGADSIYWSLGGAILCDASVTGPSSPVIRANAFQRNYGGEGGALCFYGSQSGARVHDNVFMNNTSWTGGAVALVFSGGAHIIDNIFIENRCLNSGQIGLGGAIALDYIYPRTDTVVVEGNTFYRNLSGYGSGIGVMWQGRLKATNNTFVLNEVDRPENFASTINLIYTESTADLRNNIFAMTLGGYAVAASNGASAKFGCNVFWLNEDGEYKDGPTGPSNSVVDPQLCDPFSGDLRLGVDSPCRSENNPSCGLVGALGLGCPEVVGVPEDRPPAGRMKLLVERDGIATRFRIMRAEFAEGNAVTLHVYDVQGRRIHSAELSSTAAEVNYFWKGNTLRGGFASSGMYFARCSDARGVVTAAFALVR